MAQKEQVVAVEQGLSNVKVALEKAGFNTVDLNVAKAQQEDVDAVVLDQEHMDNMQMNDIYEIEDLMSNVWS